MRCRATGEWIEQLGGGGDALELGDRGAGHDLGAEGVVEAEHLEDGDAAGVAGLVALGAADGAGKRNLAAGIDEAVLGEVGQDDGRRDLGGGAARAEPAGEALDEDQGERLAIRGGRS